MRTACSTIGIAASLVLVVSLAACKDDPVAPRFLPPRFEDPKPPWIAFPSVTDSSLRVYHRTSLHYGRLPARYVLSDSGDFVRQVIGGTGNLVEYSGVFELRDSVMTLDFDTWFFVGAMAIVRGDSLIVTYDCTLDCAIESNMPFEDGVYVRVQAERR